MEGPGDVTALLAAYSRGQSKALDQLLPLVYDELRRLAHRRRYQWREEPAPGTTSLVHEAYLNLVDHSRCQWQDRRHFFYFASVAMRNILIDNARRYRRLKRSGDAEPLERHEPRLVSQARSEELLALDDALTRLQQADERLAHIVECRFFGGLSIEETAEALSLSPATVKRGWITARSWLYKELNGP
jgi:RNA polymerase sigma factor (TIGR02999 family)